MEAVKKEYIQIEVDVIKELNNKLTAGFNLLCVLSSALHHGLEISGATAAGEGSEEIPPEIVHGCAELFYSVESDIGEASMVVRKIVKEHTAKEV